MSDSYTSGCHRSTTRQHANGFRCSSTSWAIPALDNHTPTGRTSPRTFPNAWRALNAEGRMGGCIIVFPDCFTALGGNQYINSSAIGRYADYLTKELIPYVDGELRTLAHRDHRGCFGKSSGGYGAIVHAMRYPDAWGAVADHSGDAYFDFVLPLGLAEHLERVGQVPIAPHVKTANTTSRPRPRTSKQDSTTGA